MTFLIESIIACALFTLFVFLMSRNPIKSIFNYPPAIIERCKTLGLVDDSNKPGGAVFYLKKTTALLVFGVLLGLLVRYINHCETFWCGVITSYALWNVVNWFDALVLDCIWFCHDPHFIIPGTEDMTAAYHDYWFHIKGSLIGMVLAIPSVLIDNYIDDTVLTMLDKRRVGVVASVFTQKVSDQFKLDIEKHNKQYPAIDVKVFNKSHDRFLMIDNKVYLVGASLKDLGQKWFALARLSATNPNSLITRLNAEAKSL